MATAITGTAQTIDLGGGYALRAPALRGTAQVRLGTGAARTQLRGFDAGIASLEGAMRATSVVEVREIVLDLQRVPGPATGAGLRSAQGEAALELRVPDAGPDHGQLVLSIDDAGALRWHLPEADAAPAAAPGTTRGAGTSTRFLIPATLVPPPPNVANLKQRSLVGAVGRRVLKVLVYPITDPILGAVSGFFARRWEAVKRPYRLRRFTPADYMSPDVPSIDAGALSAMAVAGPVLLFVHGTFSTSHGGFGDLPAATMTELFERYGERVIAFDHPTLADDPPANVKWLRSQLPTQRMQVDIVSHSRGGLVSRLLAQHSAVPPQVRRIVLAGVPNAGTLLTDPDHMVDMIDRLSTAITLLPDGGATDMLEALITVLKMVGRGVLTGLDGLASMRPTGEFLATLNAPGGAGTDYFAVASNYEPTDRGLQALVSGILDNLADRIFRDAGNDLVVPTDGVYQGNGNSSFPVPQERVLLIPPSDGVMHTKLFGQASVGKKLLEWLV